MNWIRANVWRALALLAFGLLISLLVQIYGLPIIGGGLKANIAAMTASRDSEVKAHRQTKDDYRAAQAEAALRETIRLARVRAEQERINADVQNSFNHRLADLRARYDGLRSQFRAGIAGSRDRSAVPGLPNAAGGTDAATGADGFPLAERLEASIYATQLDELIGWIERQTRVPVNGSVGTGISPDTP